MDARENVSEREADRVAGTVMSMASPATSDVRRDAEAEQEGLRGGRPLPGHVRAFMEPRFMTDFSQVRVHTDRDAVEMNRALRAQAFAHGSDIYYGDGKSPGNDILTAHELTHVVQQTRLHQSAVIQTSPDTEALDQVDAESKTEVLRRKAAAAIEEGGGTARFYYFDADIKGGTAFVVFDDHSVNKLYRYLLTNWLGAPGGLDSLENTSYSGVPKWVGEFRAKALNVRSPKTQDPADSGFQEQKELADLAVKLADSVAAETPGQKVRRLMVEEIDKRIGTTVMSQEAIDSERKKVASGGYTPENFTTCIEFFSQVTRAVTQKAGLGGPLLLGPNSYKEINPQAKAHLPPGAWHPCTPTTRPKPGDVLIFMFAEDEKDPATGKVKYAKGYFAHVSILRSIEPVKDTSSGEPAVGGTEKWISVDGGSTSAAEVVRYFSPDTCRIKGPGHILRTLHGWIDVEKAAEAQLVKKPGA